MKTLIPFSLVAALAAAHTPAMAKDSAEDLEDLRARTLYLIQALGKKGVLPLDKADSLVVATDPQGARRARSEQRLAELKPRPSEPESRAAQEAAARAADEISAKAAKAAEEAAARATERALSAQEAKLAALSAAIPAAAPPVPRAPKEIQVVPPETREELEALRKMSQSLTQTLVQSGILTQDKADAMLREAKRQAADKTAENGATKVVRVPYVPQVVRNEIKEELRHEVMAEAKAGGWAAPGKVPAWLEGTRFETDVRLRFQHDQFPRDNSTPFELSQAIDPISIGNSQDPNNRWRIRLRFGVESTLSEMTTLGFRLATGNLSDPLSTNQTMGNSFNRYTVGVDKAYIRLQPWHWLTLNGGRIANPFFGTDLVWHPDLNFDGVAATGRNQFNDRIAGFATLGAFPLQKIDPNSATGTETKARSKWLFGAQLGADAVAGSNRIKVGLGLYDYKHVEGIANSGILGSPDAGLYNQTVPQWRQKGNSIFDINDAVVGSTPSYGLASKFRELNLTGSWDYARWDPFHVIVAADWVKNLGFDRAEILQRTGYRDIAPKTMGYQARLTVGMPQLAVRGDWQVSLAYKYLQRDAVLDAYTDSDFRLGGTDAKGYILSASYGIDRNTWLGLKWTSADPIDGLPYSVDSLFIDLNGRF